MELSEDAQSCYLAGRVALAVDDYDLAKENFQKVIEEDSGYQQAVQIYEAYLERGMEADGTVYLEQALGGVSREKSTTIWKTSTTQRRGFQRP